ncbi:TIGR00300 family protein [Candidatus Hecatella orcuttiae]|uniref:ornithine cyclodeaminase n=1 Tax=Candidatus Hecatella orcuttiae TaxID=1935119 RepID=UPI00286816EE|nr:TIGR00300 family protein [Candidatus Hecatella orcuttiae]
MVEFHRKKQEDSFLHTRDVEVEGHLIDSMILSRIWDRIMELGGDFEVSEFRVGKRKTDYSYARMLVKGKSESHLERILQEIYRLGAIPHEVQEAVCEPAPADMVLPENFYSTTNNPTFIYFKGRWVEVENPMMDKVVVVEPDGSKAYCKPLREVRKGELVVVGETGVKVKPPERPRESIGVFKFMGSDASSEKPSGSLMKQIAKDLYDTKKAGGKIVAVAGPAVVHTGAAEALASIIREGFIDVFLSGNALAVHDVEAALLGTSLGVSLEEGVPSVRGHRNHMAAINEIYKAGSLKEAVRKGVLRKGIMYECIVKGVPFVLAGSIRDDGPLPEVVTDMVEAQRLYREALAGTSMVLMFASTLHSIAVGNMLPSTVKIVCVDINPATVTKLLDRGSMQAIGVVSDIGTFLPLLDQELKRLKGA